MASFKNSGGIIAFTAGAVIISAYSLALHGSFAPQSDIHGKDGIVQAVRDGVKKQLDGNAPQNCTISDEGIGNFGINRVSGTRSSWQNSNDHGYACVSTIYHSQNHYPSNFKTNGNRPYWVVQYSNKIGGYQNGPTLGTASVLQSGKVAVEISNDPTNLLAASMQTLGTFNLSTSQKALINSERK